MILWKIGGRTWTSSYIFENDMSNSLSYSCDERDRDNRKEATVVTLSAVMMFHRCVGLWSTKTEEEQHPRIEMVAFV